MVVSVQCAMRVMSTSMGSRPRRECIRFSVASRRVFALADATICSNLTPRTQLQRIRSHTNSKNPDPRADSCGPFGTHSTPSAPVGLSTASNPRHVPRFARGATNFDLRLAQAKALAILEVKDGVIARLEDELHKAPGDGRCGMGRW